MRQTAARPAQTVVGERDDPVARRRHAFGAQFSQPQTLRRWLRIEGRRCPQSHAGNHSGRRQRILRHPVKKPAHFRGNDGTIKGQCDGTQFFRVHTIASAIPDNARNLSGTQRNLDNRTRLHMHIVRHRIGIGLRRGQRNQYRHGDRWQVNKGQLWRIFHLGGDLAPRLD